VPVADAAPIVRAAYEQSLLYGEHTWGGALYWVTPYDSPTRMVYGDQWQRQRAEGRFARLESSWDEHTAYIDSARDLIMPQLDQQLQALVRSVNVGGQRVTVYNPLPWPRDGHVTAAWTGSPPQALRCVDSRTIVPVTVTEAGIQFVARQLPGMGYRTFVAADPVPTNDELTWDSDSCSLSGPHFTLRIDPVRGAVSSLIDKRTGRDWIDAAAPYALGQYLYERFDRDQVAAFVDAYVKIDTAWAINELGKPNLPPSDEVPYRRVSPENFDVRVEHSPVAISAVMQSASGGRLPHGVTARVTLYRDLPCVDVEVTLHDKPADPWPEAGWLCLPIHAPGARFRLGRLGSIVDPVHDLVPGSNHRLLALNTGMAVVDSSGAGLGMCPLDSPLVSLDEPGCWKYDPVYVPSSSHVYVNLFNNQWTTNFRLWNEGTWTSRVRLWALDSERIDQSLVVGALEARYPLCAAVTDGPGGPLPTMRQGVRVSCPGVLVTALGTSPDGDGTLVRLWDHAGRPGECTIDVPAALAAQSARHVDLRGSRLDVPVLQASDTLSVTIKPMAPVSLIFDPPPAP
jgi:alpha-mannosidase